MIALLANWQRILFGSALALLGGLLLIQTARIDGFLFWDGLKAENTELRKTVFDITEAQKLATKLAKQEKARIEAENERKANDARELEKKLRSDYDARLARWLQNNRRATGNPDLSSAAEATSGIAQAGPATVIPEDFALVSITDLELSAQAFAKLEALQTWANSLAKPADRP